ncbi:Luciferase-like monooxygenase [Catenulispora acidiphila DSM 44928]|uniref:Luciferase-like monooxygenase n=1 Tax=Catenulispora acidiphila (strain DSM 44928 / JCM 14897 / NBRC 102108 / NRRL B-24433 / ID139908) TaxID=479433 RepID=C7Q8I0_CATAD|nr:LLM class F420-dependent oxidoreductase [Catenulispora acidiphila]ACU76168.1 Luciferase-like monooxygenase [Catenulispora acidiphila DSM 44928]
MDLRILTEPQQGASYDALLRVARAAEELGFDGFFRSDHYRAGGAADGLPGPTDCWTTLAGLARETSRIRLGSLVTPVTFRLPGPLAIQVAQVDQMSGGRIELGLGTGWDAAEHSAYGIPFPDNRFDLLEEQLQIIRGLWSTPAGQTYSFKGAHYELSDSPALPKPAQSPHPPIIVGGRGPKRTPRLAATYASEYNSNFRPSDQVADSYVRVREACEAIGRDPDTLTLSVTMVVACGRTDAEIARRAEAISGKAAANQMVLRLTPDQLVEKLGEYHSVGAQRVYLRTFDLDDLDQLALIANEVRPHTRIL